MDAEIGRGRGRGSNLGSEICPPKERNCNVAAVVVWFSIAVSIAKDLHGLATSGLASRRFRSRRFEVDILRKHRASLSQRRSATRVVRHVTTATNSWKFVRRLR